MTIYAADCYIYKMNSYQFPRQKVLCDEKPFSRKLLHSLLKMVYSVSPPFAGYIKITGDESSILFLFFFNGAPYAAGRYAHNKPVSYSIQEFGEQLAKSAEESMSVSLCETDPVLLKCMLLFLQEEPAVKAPISLIDIEYVVRQIGEVGADAMIAICRNKKINFFFFRYGKGALAHYSDLTFVRPEGMTIEEEMLSYAFRSGEDVQVFVFRDMVTTMADDSSLLDKDVLDKLFTVGYPKNRRSVHSETSQISAGNSKKRRRGDTEISSVTETDCVENFFSVFSLESKSQSFVISVESGPLQDKRFTLNLPCIIGRIDCDLILNDNRISRRHAELKIVANKLMIEDLSSTNGTKVNGMKITSRQLKPDDLISIGPVDIKIFPA